MCEGKDVGCRQGARAMGNGEMDAHVIYRDGDDGWRPCTYRVLRTSAVNMAKMQGSQLQSYLVNIRGGPCE